MADPTFHLEAVVKSRERLEDFDGPLSLILQLLQKNRVEIKDIKIASILDQYLAYLAEMERMDLEIASGFAAMASHLMYIKARTLLRGTEEIEEMDSLKSSLEELRRRELLESLRAASEALEALAAGAEGLFTRTQEPLEPIKEYSHSHLASELAAALYDLLGRGRERAALPQSVPLPAPLPYPVDGKAEELLLRLRESGPTELGALFALSRSRSELAAALMAVLELYRNEKITLEDTGRGVMVGLRAGEGE